MTRSPLILYHRDSGTSTFYDENKDIPASENFVHAWVEGRESYYIVYEKPNFNEDHPDAGFVIMLDEPKKHLDWAVRSYRGFDCTGITLFQHRTFNGEAHHFTKHVPRLDEHFRKDHPKTLIVTLKEWSVYTEEDWKRHYISASNTNITVFTERRFFSLEEGKVAKSLGPPVS